jgi:Tat protein secretion system quality control protein TatD with DNase activity
MLEEIKYFDIHSHLHSSFFNEKEDGQKVAEEMVSKNIFSIIIGVDFLDSKKAIEMSNKNKNLFCSIGQHPLDAPLGEAFDDKEYQIILDKDKKSEKKVVCIGECGLDYF